MPNQDPDDAQPAASPARGLAVATDATLGRAFGVTHFGGAGAPMQIGAPRLPTADEREIGAPVPPGALGDIAMAEAFYARKRALAPDPAFSIAASLEPIIARLSPGAQHAVEQATNRLADALSVAPVEIYTPLLTEILECVVRLVAEYDRANWWPAAAQPETATRDPQCSADRRHRTGCACTGEHRGPITR